jgi:hypothetical protein
MYFFTERGSDNGSGYDSDAGDGPSKDGGVDEWGNLDKDPDPDQLRRAREKNMPRKIELSMLTYIKLCIF